MPGPDPQSQEGADRSLPPLLGNSPREGNEPAQIYEKASVLEAEHMVSAQKLQAESENHTRSSLEFQDSSATGFFKGYALVVVSPYPP